MALTLAKEEKIAEKLKKLPDPPATERKTTKQEAIRLLKREIVGLQRRGYSLEQIVGSLKGEGLSLSAATLKSYLSRAKGRSVGRRPAAVAAPARMPPPPKKARPKPTSPACARPPRPRLPSQRCNGRRSRPPSRPPEPSSGSGSRSGPSPFASGWSAPARWDSRADSRRGSRTASRPRTSAVAARRPRRRGRTPRRGSWPAAWRRQEASTRSPPARAEAGRCRTGSASRTATGTDRCRDGASITARPNEWERGRRSLRRRGQRPGDGACRDPRAARPPSRAARVATAPGWAGRASTAEA
jgi:hypothetical protein